MNSLIAYLRLTHAGWVMAREGVIASLPADGLRGPAKLAHRLAGLIARRQTQQVQRAERLSRAVERLGPSYVKLGQFLATRPDVVGKPPGAGSVDAAGSHGHISRFKSPERV